MFEDAEHVKSIVRDRCDGDVPSYIKIDDLVLVLRAHGSDGVKGAIDSIMNFHASDDDAHGLNTQSRGELMDSIERLTDDLAESEKLHEERMLEMSQLVSSLLKIRKVNSYSTPIPGARDGVIWIEPREYIRLYTSIATLEKRARDLIKKSDKHKDEFFHTNLFQVDERIRVHAQVGSEILELKNQISAISDQLALFSKKDLDEKILEKVRDIASEHDVIGVIDEEVMIRVFKIEGAQGVADRFNDD